MSVRDLTILGSSSQQPTRARNHGAYLLRCHGEGLLFDPGEGTQRQFIHANIAPTCVNRIFISHFHGDHCLGLGSMLMRLNLDKVTHPIHCYYPKSGKKYFDRLRYGTAYHETIHVVEHPIDAEGIVEETEHWKIEAYQLEHGIETLGFKITEKDQRKFYKDQLKELGIVGPKMRTLIEEGSIDGHKIDDLSYIRPGDSFAYISDTRLCPGAYKCAKDATLLLSESTYLSDREKMAHEHFHLTAAQAAQIAAESNVMQLIMTHFSARYLDLKEFEKEARKYFKNSYAAKDLKQFSFPKKAL